MTVFRGVDHVGVGVGDMDAANAFYGARRVLRRALRLHGRACPGPDREARVAMLSNPGRDAGRGRRRSSSCRCSTATARRRRPTGGGWGELGICEICLHARGVTGVHRASSPRARSR